MAHSQGVDWESGGGERVNRLFTLLTEGRTMQETAAILSAEFNESYTKDSVNNAKQRWVASRHFIERDSSIKIYETLRIPQCDCMVACDIHSPYHSELWVNRFLAIADKFKIKKAVLVGDTFDMDFAKSHYDDEHKTLDEEIEQNKSVMTALDFFETVYALRGNHEKRPGWMSDSKVQARHILGLFGQRVWEEKFQYSTDDHASMGDDWMFVHPRSYSQISASVAVGLSEKFQRNVINAHGHFFAFRYNRSGRHIAIDLGGLFDRAKTKYIHESTTTHPVWNPGFGMIIDNYIHLFHEKTDFNFWLRGWV